MIFEKTIEIEKSKSKYLQDLLDRVEIDFKKEGISEDEVLETFTAVFENDFEADIKVCAGQNNCFIDPILFKKGSEVCVNDTEETLIGEYSFEFENDVFIVYVVEV